MRALLALFLVACSSPAPTPKPRIDPTDGSATTTSAATLTPGVELPEVALSGFATADGVKPAVSATLAGLTVDGTAVARMKDGVLLPDELEGGEHGRLVIRLATIAERFPKDKPVMIAADKRIPYRTLFSTLYTLKQAGHTELGLLARAGAHVVMAPITVPEQPPASVAEGRTPASDLGAQIEAAKQTNTSASILRAIQDQYMVEITRCYKRALEREPTTRGKLILSFTVDVAGKTTRAKASGITPVLDACVGKLMASWRFPAAKDPAGETFSITLVLVPDDAGATAGTPAPVPAPQPATSPLGLFVTVTKTELILWSVSGLEGTVAAPKLVAKLSEKSALADLGNALAEIVARRFPTTRTREDRAIVIQADAAIPLQTIAEVIGAVRATPDGKDLFPDLQFAEAFE